MTSDVGCSGVFWLTRTSAVAGGGAPAASAPAITRAADARCPRRRVDEANSRLCMREIPREVMLDGARTGAAVSGPGGPLTGIGSALIPGLRQGMGGRVGARAAGAAQQRQA